MSKKIFLAGAVICAALLLNISCNKSTDESKKDSKTTELTIVSTIFPEYDWMVNLTAGAPVKNELLISNGVDLHSYQASVQDIIKIAESDMFIYVGGESDFWVDDVLENHKNVKGVKLLELIKDDVKEEEVVEGMQTEEEEDEEAEEHHHEDEEDEDGEEHHHHEDEESEEGHHHHHHHDEDEVEYDEHVWLSVRLANKLCAALTEKLVELDPANESIYRANYAKYSAELTSLDKEYESVINEGNRNTVLFADRFPFRYMTDDYGLNYYAAFVGCSAETAASFETMAFLTQKVDELKLPVILVLEKSDCKIADTVIGNTNAKDQKVMEMDSIQSVTVADMSAGKTYLSSMKKNLETLKEALK